MKTIRRTKGQFREQPYYTLEEIEHICLTELKSVGLFPSTPSPVRIERFIEKRFGVSPIYEDVPEGVMGFTLFSARGVREVVISRRLLEDGGEVSERRLNSTLAHEAGHGLLHAHLFALEELTEPLFGEMEHANQVKVLCREDSVGVRPSRTYEGRWWEFQANRAIGALLLPKPLVEACLRDFLVPLGTLGGRSLRDNAREEGVRILAGQFDVNPVVARIRVSELYPVEQTHQLTL